MRKKRFEKDDIATVVLPSDVPRESPVWKYDGQKLKVNKASSAQLELKDAVSSMGVPYTFLGEWVRLAEEGGSK